MKARGIYADNEIESCRDILIRADVKAWRYDGISTVLELIFGGEAIKESMTVGRFVKTAGAAVVLSAGGGVKRLARSE